MHSKQRIPMQSRKDGDSNSTTFTSSVHYGAKHEPESIAGPRVCLGVYHARAACTDGLKTLTLHRGPVRRAASATGRAHRRHAVSVEHDAHIRVVLERQILQVERPPDAILVTPTHGATAAAGSRISGGQGLHGQANFSILNRYASPYPHRGYHAADDTWRVSRKPVVDPAEGTAQAPQEDMHQAGASGCYPTTPPVCLDNKYPRNQPIPGLVKRRKLRRRQSTPSSGVAAALSSRPKLCSIPARQVEYPFVIVKRFTREHYPRLI